MSGPTHWITDLAEQGRQDERAQRVLVREALLQGAAQLRRAAPLGKRPTPPLTP
jgi:hypothetical protein